MLTIGEFSRICMVTKKTLRFYDEIGLLRPEHIADNGYRYYTVDQLRTMRLITRLKTYGLSLPEIAAVLANPDEDLLADRLLARREQIRRELEQTNHILAQLGDDVEKLRRRIDIMEQNIVVNTTELAPQTIFGIRQKMSVKDFGQQMGRVYQEAGQKGLQPAGAPLAIYHDADFDPERSEIEIAVPVTGGGEGIRQLPGGLHCYAVMTGSYNQESFSAVHAGLCKWLEENGYRIAGAPFDKYVKGGGDVPEEEYVTEVYYPIAK